jgi:hypothetical protein
VLDLATVASCCVKPAAFCRDESELGFCELAELACACLISLLGCFALSGSSVLACGGLVAILTDGNTKGAADLAADFRPPPPFERLAFAAAAFFAFSRASCSACVLMACHMLSLTSFHKPICSSALAISFIRIVALPYVFIYNLAEGKNMKKTFSIITFVVAFTVVFYIAKESRQTYANNESLDTASKKTEKIIINALNDAKEKATEDRSATEILKAESNKQIQKNMTSNKSDKDKLADAASNFYGYYLINVEARKEYCERNGTPISKFLIEFKEKNNIVFQKSTKILEKHFSNANNKFSYKMMADLMSKSLGPLLNQDMEDIKNNLKINDKEACHLFNDRSVQIVESISYEKQNKIGYEMLFNARD